MKPMNKEAEKTFKKLTEGLGIGGERKVDNGGEGIMAVHVIRRGDIELGPVFSIAHFWTQNGDQMADPEMDFVVAQTDGRVYPLSFRQDGGFAMNNVAVVFGEGAEAGKITGVRPRMQRDQATFAGTWMRNIKMQQGL